MNPWNLNLQDFLAQVQNGMTNTAATSDPAPIARTPAGDVMAPKVKPKPVMPQVAPERKLQQQSELEKFQQYLSGLSDSSAKEKQAIDAYEQSPQKVDLSPLLALSDAWYGGSQAKSYQAPETPQQRQMVLAKLRNAAGEGDRDLAKQQLALYMGGEKNDAMANRALMGAITRSLGGMQEQNLQFKKDDKLTKEFGAFDKPLQEKAEQFRNLNDAFASHDYQTVWSTLAQYARGVSGEKGVLTDKDITRVMPANFQGTLAQWKAYWNGVTPTTELPPEYTASLEKMMKVANRNLLLKYHDQVSKKKLDLLGTASYQDSNSREGVENAHKNAIDSLRNVGDLDTALEWRSLKKPKEIEQADWDKADDVETRRAMVDHFGKAK